MSTELDQGNIIIDTLREAIEYMKDLIENPKEVMLININPVLLNAILCEKEESFQ